MSFVDGSSLNYGQEGTFRATHLWQELILSFRLTMPCCKHRLKVRWYDNSFTGREAVEWLHAHLQTTGLFGTVTREQSVKLLQKFVHSDVIQEVRGKLTHFDEDTSYLYRFVTEPGPFNFIEDVCMASPRPMSPIGKRGRTHSVHSEGGGASSDYNGACFTNEYAFMRCEEPEETEIENEPMILGTSPLKKSRSDGSIAKRLAVFDVNSQAPKLAPTQVAAAWKEITLSRILRLVDLPALDSVLSHDAVDGKQIVSNATLGSKSFLSKTAAKIRQSVPRSLVHDKKPPLPPSSSHPHKSHCLTTTHHHKRRFSTKIKSDSNPTHNESVTDVPQWVVLAIRCLAKWPDGCTEEFVGGMPVYCGFELDVFQSLIQYFQGLSEPLISVKLYDLHVAVHSLLNNGKPGVTEALQLCTLLLPQTNRCRLHRMLRLIYKASTNTQLRLSKTQSNKDVLLRQFASVVVRSSSKLSKVEESERIMVEKLVGYMAQHYQQIFKVPDDLRKDVHKLLDARSSGKSDFVPEVCQSACSRLTSQQYEEESKKTSHVALLGLLDSIIADHSMSVKDKKHKLREFQAAYPTLYAERLPSDTPLTNRTPPNQAGRSAKKPRRHTSLSFSGRSRPSPSLFRKKSECATEQNTVILR